METVPELLVSSTTTNFLVTIQVTQRDSDTKDSKQNFFKQAQKLRLRLELRCQEKL